MPAQRGIRIINIDKNRNLAQKVGSTYTCEPFFSKMKFVKDESRLNLTDENLQHQLRCASTNISIGLQKLRERVEKKNIPLNK